MVGKNKGFIDMAFDVFLAYAPEDMDMASLIARRLRALKFKVRFNKKGEGFTFDDKDARDALKSQSMLVLWSENAVKSDWVRAAASIGHSRPGMLVQTGLDDTIPYEPFRLDKRYELAGFTSRTNVEGWYETVEELGRRDGRVDLRAWIDIPTKDEDAKTAWLGAHPTDPLALHAKNLRDKKLGIVPARAAAATGAAALAASAIGTGKASPAPVAPAPLSSTATVMEEDERGFDWLIPLLLLGIGLLFLFAWLNRTQALPRAAGITTQLVQTCPAGTIPRDVFASETLEAGPIINDVDE